MPNKIALLTFLAAALAGFAPNAALAQDTPAEETAGMEAFLSRFTWVKGPSQATMTRVAAIDVPAGYMFTDGEGTRGLLQAMGNLTDGSEVGFLSPTNMDWFVVFSFTEDGFVKDDDKDKLDPAGMLKVIRKGNDYANEEKAKLGLSPMRITGWAQEPRYDETTHNLEWAIRAESDDGPIVNYNTRLLGRRGVMQVQLVVNPDALTATLPQFKTLLATYAYQTGETYAEYKPGDKLAKYGLAALVTGAGVAVAAKTGLLAGIALLFKKLWKLIVVAVVAVGSMFRRLIFGRTARVKETATE